MRYLKLVRAAITLPLVLTASAYLSQPSSPSTSHDRTEQPISLRVVSYQIDARLDVGRKTIDAKETLTYRNLTGRSLDTFPFHLYLNAFQPTSTFMREVRLYGTWGRTPGSEWDPKHYGAIEVKSFEALGQGDLTRELHFIQPDDTSDFRNPDDHTVVQVRLRQPVTQGAEVTFRFAFHDQLPEVLARTGYKRDFFMVGQWFPKVGVWWHGAWNCHQFHANTEFFADFGTYDVKLTVPQNYVLGSSGDEVSSAHNPDGTKTVTYHAEDIHDFAWTADPNFRIVEDSWTGSCGTVKIHLLMSPEHRRQKERYLEALKGALDRFDRWYGPYPYDRITLVDPPHGALQAGGMEYPTLITGGAPWWEPGGVRGTEVVTVHEFGHQYWYGMVATNEFEEAWMDEGIDSYTEVKAMDSLYGSAGSMLDFWGLTAGESGMQRWFYLSQPDTDPMARFAYQYMDMGAYGAITYGKTATVLLTLEGLLGQETMRQAMRTYFMRYRFTHPTAQVLLKTIEEVSGQNLRWYFDQAVYGTSVLDYEVLSIRSERVGGYEKHPPEEKKGQTLYRNTVLVHRKGDFIFPVEVEVKFDNGERVREKWDGRDRWVRFSYDKKAKIVSAEVDPEHRVWLDKDRFNNSQTAEPNRAATRKLATYWLIASQMLAQLLAWLA